MRIGFIGHLSLDTNVVGDVMQQGRGGGSFYGAAAAARLGADAAVYTKCAVDDRAGFAQVLGDGVALAAFPSPRSTAFRNDYPSDNPDQRITTALSLADPFTALELAAIQADVIHVNPLWHGEFPPALLPAAREHAVQLAADAQGFVRRVAGDGRTYHEDWADKETYLPLLDLLKVDHSEAITLTGLDDIHAAAATLIQLGASAVLLTHRQGLLAQEGDQVAEAPFGSYPLIGRTGRGDTATAAFLVARETRDLGAAVRYAAQVTTAKMQYPGPYKG
jgi:sugar/nucleoside kinase (ribokinase family)